jgi:hypothetical protein
MEKWPESKVTHKKAVLVLRPAQQEILQLMSVDSFGRFR